MAALRRAPGGDGRLPAIPPTHDYVLLIAPARTDHPGLARSMRGQATPFCLNHASCAASRPLASASTIGGRLVGKEGVRRIRVDVDEDGVPAPVLLHLLGGGHGDARVLAAVEAE